MHTEAFRLLTFNIVLPALLPAAITLTLSATGCARPAPTAAPEEVGGDQAREQATQSRQAPEVSATPDNRAWWPDRLDLRPLRQNEARSNPLGEDFDYA